MHLNACPLTLTNGDRRKGDFLKRKRKRRKRRLKSGDKIDRVEPLKGLWISIILLIYLRL